jgi:hypothetical protein
MEEGKTMLMDRIIGALTFRREVYAEVEHDESFTSTAWILVIVVSFLSQLGSFPIADNIVNWLISVVVGTIFSVVAFAVAAIVVAMLGKALFNAEVTNDEMIRTLGLAYVWRVVGLIGVVSSFSVALSCVLAPIAFIAGILGLVSWFVAAREALDLEMIQTVITVVIGWAVFLLIGALAGFVLGILGLGAAAVLG